MFVGDDGHPQWRLRAGSIQAEFMRDSYRDGGAQLGRAMRFLRRLGGKQFDAAVICGYKDPISLLAWIVARLRGIPLILGLDTVDVRRPGYKRLLRGAPLKCLYRNTACFWVPGKASADYLMGRGVGVDRIYQGMYSLDIDSLVKYAKRLEQERNELRSQLGVSGDLFWYLMVARLIRSRNVLALMRALAHARALGAKIGLLVVGDGPERGSAESYVAKRGMAEVKFFSQVDFVDLGRFYAAADAFVMPSSEPYSVAVVEAAIFAKPIIAANSVGASKDYVHDGRTGVVYDSESVEELSSALMGMAGNPARARRMGEAARVLAMRRGREWAVSQLRAAVLRALPGQGGH